jgi:predicted 3-demethylubiquinone-9 3-methyltransferase (glyoxalase superfamily)
MQKITPFLWFDDKAEEAASFYTSTFKNAKITSVVHYNEAGPRPAGSVMMVSFEIEGQAFTALNGGPYFSFTPAISFFITCETQAEVDHLWEILSEGGEQEQCGWVKDKYGISWQIVPSILSELMQSENAKKANNVTKAMLQMRKLDIAALKRAYEEG